MSVHHRIVRNSLVIGLALLAGRLAMLARELAMAGEFGRADDVEAFLIAYLGPLFVVSIVSTGFGYAFVPTYLQVRAAEGREAARRVAGSVGGWSLLALALCAAALAAAAPWYVPLLASNFDPSKLALTEKLAWMLAPLALLGGMSAIWSALLNAEDSFGLPALATVLEPAAAVLALMLAQPASAIYALAAGSVAGAALQAALLAAASARKGLAWRPRLVAPDAASRRVMRQCAPMLLSASVAGAVPLVDNAMAGALEAGSVAAFGYGRRLVDVLVGVAALAVGTAAFPYLSRIVALRDWARCREAVRMYSALVFLALLPVTALIVAFSPELIAALYERGRFSPGDTAVVANVQMLYALQVPFYLGAVIGNRMIAALGEHGFFVYAAVGLVALKVALNALLAGWLGVTGIALATSLAYFVSGAAVLAYVRSALARAARS